MTYEISKITLPNGITYDLKDSYAREDLSTLGNLAYQNTASGSYTPQGSVSQPSFSGIESNITLTI